MAYYKIICILLLIFCLLCGCKTSPKDDSSQFSLPNGQVQEDFANIEDKNVSDETSTKTEGNNIDNTEKLNPNTETSSKENSQTDTQVSSYESNNSVEFENDSGWSSVWK